MTLGPPGWQTHQPMSSRVRSVVGEEGVDVVADVALDQRRHLGVEHDAQPGARDVEAHRALAVGVEPAARVEHPDGATVAGVADGDDGRGPVAEEAAGHQVGHRGVVALHGQRAQLDRDQDGDVVGVAEQVVVHAGDPGGARHAAQADQRHPAYVLAQPDDPGDPGVERRHREPGDGGGHDEVDVGRREVGGLERVDQRLRAELDGVLDEQVVGVAEVAERRVVGQRQHAVPSLDAGVAVEPPQQRVVEAALGDHGGEGLGDLGLRVGVRGQGAAGGQDPHAGVLAGRGRFGSRGRGCGSARPPGGGRCGRRRGRSRRGRRRRGGRGRRRGCRRRRCAATARAGRRPRCGAGAGRGAYAPRGGGVPRRPRGVGGRRRGRPCARRRSRWRRRSRCPRRSSGSPVRRRRRRGGPARRAGPSASCSAAGGGRASRCRCWRPRARAARAGRAGAGGWAAGRRTPRRAAARRSRRWRGRRRGRRPRRTTAAGGRRSG